MSHSHNHKDYYKAPKDLTDMVVNATLKAQQELADECFERWKTYIGVENCDHDPITKEGLKEWAANTKREFQCVFCNETFTIDQLIKQIACPNCKEYKGIIPYIPSKEHGHV